MIATAPDKVDSTSDGVRLVLTFEAMHDEHWTKMAVLGGESQLGRLQKKLAV